MAPVFVRLPVLLADATCSAALAEPLPLPGRPVSIPSDQDFGELDFEQLSPIQVIREQFARSV